jgi:hypothetical protein
MFFTIISIISSGQIIAVLCRNHRMIGVIFFFMRFATLQNQDSQFVLILQYAAVSFTVSAQISCFDAMRALR